MLVVFQVREWTVWLYGVFDSAAAIKEVFPGAKMVGNWDQNSFGTKRGDSFEYFYYDDDLYTVAKSDVNRMLGAANSPGELIAEFEDACPYD